MKDPAYAALREDLAPQQPTPEELAAFLRAALVLKGKGSKHLTNRRARTRLAKKKAQTARLKAERRKK